jgi:1-acyl-sn-glycerol-3-phosphate acyltransferase
MSGIDRIRSQLNRIVASLTLLVVFPVIAISDKLRKGSGIRVTFKAIDVLARLCGIKFSKVGTFDLDEAIIVANHSSYMDIPAVLAVLGEVRFIGAQELYKIPLLSSAMKALNTVPLARKNPDVARRQLVDLAVSGALCTAPLVIFPEGRIRTPDEPIKFKLGAFSLGIDSKVPIVPVAIHNSAGILPRGAFFAPRPGEITIEILEPIMTTHMTSDDLHALRDEVQRRISDSVDRVLKSP